MPGEAGAARHVTPSPDFPIVTHTRKCCCLLAPLMLVYLTAAGIMLFFETGLVYPAPGAEVGDDTPQQFAAEEVRFESADGTRLHGWFFPRHNRGSPILFFHGNGENVALTGREMSDLSDRLDAPILVFDYRGYGQSEGSPHEQGVVADGIAAVEWLCQRTGKSPDQLVYLGRSLGGGVAVQVAGQMPPRALILVSTFSSLVDVAARVFPWLPVRWLMRNRYESARVISRCPVPLLQIHGVDDTIVPLELGERLHAASGAEHKKFLSAAGLGHNDLPLEAFVEEINRFIDAARPQR